MKNERMLFSDMMLFFSHHKCGYFFLEDRIKKVKRRLKKDDANF